MQTRPPVRITGRQFCNAFSGLRIDSKSAFYCLTGARATRLLRMGLLAASTAGDALVVGIGRGAVLWRAGTATTLRGADDDLVVRGSREEVLQGVAHVTDTSAKLMFTDLRRHPTTRKVVSARKSAHSQKMAAQRV